MIEVKVIRVPGVVKTVALNDGATVADALTAAELTKTATEKLSVNAETASMEQALNDGDRVILSVEAKSAV